MESNLGSTPSPCSAINTTEWFADRFGLRPCVALHLHGLETNPMNKTLAEQIRKEQERLNRVAEKVQVTAERYRQRRSIGNNPRLDKPGRRK